MEEGMRHFYVRAMAAKQAKQPDEVIDAAMIQAVQIAEKIAPYRHARLSALRWRHGGGIAGGARASAEQIIRCRNHRAKALGIARGAVANGTAPRLTFDRPSGLTEMASSKS
jgi:hypothetical protein